MKKLGHILARRLRGDLLLTDDPLTNREARIITPGAWLTDDEQDILEEDTVKNYRLGTRMVLEDRVFRYCHAKEDLDSQSGAFVEPDNYYEGNGAMGICDAGATVIYFDNKVGEPIGADELAGGYVTGCSTDPTDAKHMYTMKIKSNLASDGFGGAVPTCKLTLERPMAKAVVGATHRAYVYPSMFKNVVNHGTTVAGGDAFNKCRGTVICVPLFYVTAGKYFWGLTWGIFYPPCGNQGINVGLTDNKRVFGFDGFGQMQYLTPNTADSLNYQQGGYIMMDGNHAAGGGDQLCMLQLMP